MEGLPIDEEEAPLDPGLYPPDGGKLLLKLGNLPAVLLFAELFI